MLSVAGHLGIEVAQIADGSLQIENGSRCLTVVDFLLAFCDIGRTASCARDSHDITTLQRHTGSVARRGIARRGRHIAADVGLQKDGRMLVCTFGNEDVDILIRTVFYVGDKVEFCKSSIVYFARRHFNRPRHAF